MVVILGVPRKDSPPAEQNKREKASVINFDEASRIWRSNKMVASPLAFTYKRAVGDEVFVRVQDVWRICTVMKLHGVGSLLVKAYGDDATRIVEDHPLSVRSIWATGMTGQGTATSSTKEVNKHTSRRSGTSRFSSECVVHRPPFLETCCGCHELGGGFRGELIKIKCCKANWHGSCMAAWTAVAEVEESCVRCQEKTAERGEEQIYAVRQRKIYRKRRLDVADQCVKRQRKNVTALPRLDSSDLYGSMDLHQSACYSCGYGGSLLCCDTCTLVWHLECLDGRMKTVPVDRWSCPICVLEQRTDENQVEPTCKSTVMRESQKELSANHRHGKMEATTLDSVTDKAIAKFLLDVTRRKSTKDSVLCIPKLDDKDTRAKSNSKTKLLTPEKLKLDATDVRTKPKLKIKLQALETEKPRPKTKIADTEPLSPKPKSQRRAANKSVSCGWEMVPSLSFDEQIALAIRMSAREDRDISRHAQHNITSKRNVPSVLVCEESSVETVPSSDEEFEFVITEGTRKDMVEAAYANVAFNSVGTRNDIAL